MDFAADTWYRSEPTPPARRKRGRPRDPQADVRILGAACTLILERGFDTMTVDDVASMAGVGKATVYRRWARKEDLAVAAMESLYRNEMPAPDTGSLHGDLTELLTATFNFANSESGTDYLRMTVKEVMRDSRIAAIYRRANNRYEQLIRSLFERGRQRGELDRDIDVTSAAEFISSLLITRTVAGRSVPSTSEVDGLVDFVLNGLRAGSLTRV
ncbi:MAG: TetR/AcrR family transcriptional regulator [Nocardioidaceae bacterium]